MSFDLLALLGGCFIAAFCSGLAGFAFNLVAAGILYHWVTPQEIAPVLVLGSLLVQSVTLRAVWPAIRWPVLKPYVFAGALGTPFGVWALSVVEARVIVAGIGILLVGYAGFMLARIALRLAPPKLAAGPRADAVVGFFAGALGGIGGFSGALPSMWTDVKGLRKDEARAIFQPFIV
ncbi:MAG: sulfite exporter TauE/SafE family protein, partial [Alphaproteobacteria bacterium]